MRRSADIRRKVHMEKGKYDDILHASRPVSLRHPPMAMRERAAQFSPFAALSGYEAAVRESARRTEKKADLDDGIKGELNEQLLRLQEAEATLPEAEFVYFLADERKAGGAYRRIRGRVRHVDAYLRTVLMEDGLLIPMEDIAEITSSLGERAEWTEFSDFQGEIY